MSTCLAERGQALRTTSVPSQVNTSQCTGGNERHRRYFWILVSAIVGAASVTAQPAAGQGVHVRRYDLAGKATLFISVPSDWKQEIRNAKSASPTIVFAPPTGSSFQLLITPVPNANPSFWEDPDKLRTVVKEDAWRLLGRLVDNDANLVELKGKAALGYTYTLRGRARGASPLITVGSLLASDFLVHFSLA